MGLGTDGAASNDATNLFHEARQACLVARVLDADASAMTAREALEIATLGGAEVLGRTTSVQSHPVVRGLHRHRPGSADARGRPARPGCGTRALSGGFGGLQLIHGRRVVDPGHLTTLDVPPLVSASIAWLPISFAAELSSMTDTADIPIVDIGDFDHDVAQRHTSSSRCRQSARGQWFHVRGRRMASIQR